MTQILTSRGADGPSDVFKHLYGHPYNIIISGNFGGGVVTLQSLSPDDVWIDIPNVSITTPTMISLKGFPATYRLWIEGSVAPNINAWAIGQTLRILELQTHAPVVDGNGNWIVFNNTPVVRKIIY